MMLQQNENTHHYILDPSALVYGGIGKIKQWFESTMENPSKDFNVVFYVPLYTLKELDFLKKVYNPLISASARDSIKFIDNQISGIQFDDNTSSSFSDNDSDFGGNVSDIGEELDVDNVENDHDSLNLDNSIKATHENDDNFDDYIDFESYNKMKSLKTSNYPLRKERKPKKSPIVFILEDEDNIGPDWKIASGYRRTTPLLSQLPKPINGSSSKGQFNHDQKKKVVGVFGNNIPGTFNMTKNHENLMSVELNDTVFSENVQNINTSKEDGDDDEKAIVPLRLKYLIRSCIQKQYIENKHLQDSEKINWDIISEDMTTSIWLKSFGLSVKTLNEVQNDFNNFSGISKVDVLFDPNSGKLVDSTSGDLKKKENKKNFKKQDSKKTNNAKKDESGKAEKKKRSRSKNKNKNNKKEDTVNAAAPPTEPYEPGKPHVVSADSFARRGAGDLWVP